MFPGEDDPLEQYLHENQVPRQINEEDEPIEEEGPKGEVGDDGPE